MPNKKLKAAVIGLGGQSIEDHIPAIQFSNLVDLVGVVDNDKDKMKKFLKDNKGIKGFNSFDDLLKKVKIDFVVISLPHCKHYEFTKKAILNGIHILKDKPLAISLEQAEELISLAEKNDVKILTALQRRFNPIYFSFLQLIDKIGKPFYIEAKYSFFVNNPDDGWRGKKKLAGGGCLIDMGYHIIDLLMWYFGLPNKVFAETSCTAKEDCDYDAEDTARVIFKYEDKDLWGSMLISRVIPPKEECIKVFGTHGIISLERGKIERYNISGEMQESLKRENGWPSAAFDQVECFIKIIKKEKDDYISPRFHLNHLAFIKAAYQSKIEGKYINPSNFIKDNQMKKV